MDAIISIMDTLGWGPNTKWVDDLFNFQIPIAEGPKPGTWVYGHGLVDIFRLAKRLGIPWHMVKTTDYAFVGIYLGFLWNLLSRTVSLPDKKRLKYLGRVEDALKLADTQKQRMTLDLASKLGGTLTHITFVYPHGRTYLTSLCVFIASFGDNKFTQRYPPRSVISDLKWWRKLLKEPTVARSLRPRGPCQDIGISVDASTEWGIGIVIGNTWDAWYWAMPASEWKREGRDIGWAEMVAIELVVRRLEELGTADANLLVRSDNEGVIKAVRRGRSRNFQVNLAIRRVEAICMARNLVISLEYVCTTANKADPVSRGIPDRSLERFWSAFELPEELKPFVLHARK